MKSDKGTAASAGSGTASEQVAVDAGAAVAVAPDAGKAVTPPDFAEDDLFADAKDVLASDVATGIDAMLSQLSSGDQSGRRLALRARLTTEIAQELVDQ